MTDPTPDYYAQAACLGADPNLFHPERFGRNTYGPEALTQIRQAQQICAGCPARKACYDHALEHETPHQYTADVIYAGLTTRDRQKIKFGKARLKYYDQPAAKAAPTVRRCDECNNTFTPSSRGNQRFCGPDCRRESERHRQRNLTCTVCQVVFTGASPNRKYCSDLCRSRNGVLKFMGDRADS